MTIEVKLFCPQCGAPMQEHVSEGEHTDKEVTCSSCGAKSEVGHLKTAEGKTLLQQALDTAKDSFKRRK